MGEGRPSALCGACLCAAVGAARVGRRADKGRAPQQTAIISWSVRYGIIRSRYRSRFPSRTTRQAGGCLWYGQQPREALLPATARLIRSHNNNHNSAPAEMQYYSTTLRPGAKKHTTAAAASRRSSVLSLSMVIDGSHGGK